MTFKIKPVVCDYAVICVDTNKVMCICSIKRNAELIADVLNGDNACHCAYSYDVYPDAKYKMITKTVRLTNSEWIDFLSEQFDISRTSAKEMLHRMMLVKKEDNFKKQFNGKNKGGNNGNSNECDRIYRQGETGSSQ